ncbi:hypothetical protein [Sinosporangium siamense]|nr:hypothetical protein [Sinosporangium siamense]
MPAPDVAALLLELERFEPDVVDDATTAVEWLTGGDPLESITQLDVCEFLWFTLPLKVGGDQVAVARALGLLFTLGGMARYAALCAAPTTARILRAYAEEGEDAGTAAYQAALDATGVLPPDIPDLGWSSIMGPEEHGAHVACSAALELAIVSGELQPGSPAWKRRREALTRRWLTETRPELGHDSWLHRVHGERLNRWVLGRGSARRELAQPFEVRLHAPIPVPDGDPVPPLTWLLDRASREGLPLTREHRPARSVTAAAAHEFGARHDVGALAHLARTDLGALTRNGRVLELTPLGARLLTDRESLWHSVTGLLLGSARSDLEVAAQEAGLMLLAEGNGFTDATLAGRVADVVDLDEGSWEVCADVAPSLTSLMGRLDALGMLVVHDGLTLLTPVGRSAALAALRAHALRPRKYVTHG